MKLLHLSDLHIGKKLNNFSLLEDQEYILNSIIKIVDEERPDGVIIAGDVYDKPVPSAEAVELFDRFLEKLHDRRINTFIISGNHDSAERLGFGSGIMDMSGIHMSTPYNGRVKCFTLTDEYGPCNIYMLPFIKPATVRRFFEEEINTYTEAVDVVLKHTDVNTEERNVIISHQFITNSTKSESEEVSVGGLDQVDGEVFHKFDYVALGHIHGPQSVGRETLRYCGTPLKYSFSEAKHDKSVTVVELKEKGIIDISTRSLSPMRDMVELKGNYDLLTSKTFYSSLNRDDYYHITLTDEEEILNAMGRLRTIYPNIMKLDYENLRTAVYMSIDNPEEVETKSQLEIFGELYEAQNNRPLDEEQKKIISSLIESIWEEE